MSLIQFVKSKVFFKQFIIAVIGLVVFGFAIAKWLNFSTNHEQKIQVPNLEKMSLNEVETILEDLDLNFVVIDSASFNPNYPKKSVINQTPEPGDFVKENRKIYLTLNPSDYEKIEVPNLFGRTKRQATSELLALGFQVSSKEIFVKDIAKDVVRGLKFKGKDLKAGEKIPKNSLISLILGDGEGSGRYKQNKED
jgi:beta-lactam-binding protein with PASTA domain